MAMNMTRKALAVASMLIAGQGTVLAQDAAPQLSDDQVKELKTFITGNATFVMFHEAGHMLISELGLPVLGREEDAVDALSSILLLEAQDETLDTAMTDAADGWFLNANSSDAPNQISEDAFWDTHGLNKQRAYAMVCMMVGQDAEGFKAFADSVELPPERREECGAEYQKAKDSWFSVLAPHQITDGSKNNFTVTYEQPADESQVPYADLIKENGLLEGVADVFSELYKLNDGIRLTAKSCGQPNAFWSPGERQLTFCYELAQFHGQLLVNWFQNGGESADTATTDENAANADTAADGTDGASGIGAGSNSTDGEEQAQ